MSESEKYNEFIKRLEDSYPQAMRNVYCGVSISEGWYHIVESLVRNIHHHIKWKREQRARVLMMNRAIKRGREAVVARVCYNGKPPGEWEYSRADNIIAEGIVEPPVKVKHIEIHQIKEKFAGLRFYYQGGDEQVYGMVRMAEAWAADVCEVCGARGEQRPGGWIRTLCDEHAKKRG